MASSVSACLLSLFILFSTNISSGFPLQICARSPQTSKERQWEITSQTQPSLHSPFPSSLFSAPHTSSELTNKQHKALSSANVFGLITQV
ncbi:hypothetical protein DdX_17413 [Ditylenchus destructor]|uniref:Uncharacterized protein n=1 Tax=Ditylenchus destructor TaxID=166010 RepID=A0AAD4MML7_9BILA|nr:hypothetical protein DdX_17413 [Ditylenchus destructor]